MKIAFFGTPIFSAKILEALLGEHEVVACVTAPDSKSKRGKKLNPSEVKMVALEKGLDLYQPAKLNQEFLELFQAVDPDLAVVVSYGRIIPEALLKLPKYGFINIHASILPRWRGAAPIHRAILSGDRETGISIMQMDKGLDTGDVFDILRCEIGERETTGSLHDKLLELGSKGILDFLRELEECDRSGGKMRLPWKQNDADSTYADKIHKDLSNIDWSRPGAEIERLVRALNPYPSARTAHQGELLKIHMADFLPKEHALEFGEIAESGKNGIYVACSGGLLRITEIQRAGSKVMPVGDFLRGKKLDKGDRLS